jgi:hypothetical protein
LPTISLWLCSSIAARQPHYFSFAAKVQTARAVFIAITSSIGLPASSGVPLHLRSRQAAEGFVL